MSGELVTKWRRIIAVSCGDPIRSPLSRSRYSALTSRVRVPCRALVEGPFSSSVCWARFVVIVGCQSVTTAEQPNNNSQPANQPLAPLSRWYFPPNGRSASKNKLVYQRALQSEMREWFCFRASLKDLIGLKSDNFGVRWMAALSSAECCESQTSPCTTGKGYQRRWQLHLFFFFWFWDDNWSKRSNTRTHEIWLRKCLTRSDCAGNQNRYCANDFIVSGAQKWVWIK